MRNLLYFQKITEAKMEKKVYVAIDLKSFYASVECVERGLDPIDTNLVVADESRTEKTICLAVSLALKSFGVPGRPRLFEVIEKVKSINALRRMGSLSGLLTGNSCMASELRANSSLALHYVVAPPRMAHYIKFSTDIYKIYLKYAAPDDIHVYSIDEVFIDCTGYLRMENITAREFAKRIVLDIKNTTGIIATAGIGTNLYLCKVALDILAKHEEADKDGVRIGWLDEKKYRNLLWTHTPLTDFWRIGHGYQTKLEALGLYTMGDIARCSLGKITDYYNEDLLYKTFGINAELLIDHAWGYESCTIKDIKSYKPETNSISSGQVLKSAYTHDKAGVVLREMASSLAMDLFEKGLVTDQIVLTIGYDSSNTGYYGESKTDHYGRKVPKHSHGTSSIPYTSSVKKICAAAAELYENITNKDLTIRRINIAACRVIPEGDIPKKSEGEQLSLFDTSSSQDTNTQEDEKEKRIQRATVEIQKKYGKNALLKVSDLEEGATQIERNNQIGGHKK